MAREPLQAATLAGALVYAAFRLAYFMFYGAFGITPEEVGHGYVSTLAQSVVGGFFIFLFLFVVLFVLIGPLIVTLGVTLSMFRHYRKVALITGPLVVVGAFVVGWTFFPGSVEPPAEADPATAGTVLAVGSWVLYCLNFGDVKRHWSLRHTFRTLRATLIPLSLASAFAVLFVVMPILARRDADAAIAGRAKPAQFAGVLNLPWAADIAYIDWVDASPPPAFSGEGTCFLYLGRTDGVMVLWNPEGNEIHRVPAAKVMLSSPGDEECPAS